MSVYISQNSNKKLSGFDFLKRGVFRDFKLRAQFPKFPVKEKS